MAPNRLDRTYTVAQRTALDGMLDSAHALRTARAEFVNHTLQPGGTVGDAATLDTLEREAAERVRTMLADPGAVTDPAKLAEATDLARELAEIRDHRAQGRFLFVLDMDGRPMVYFQCAVAHNEDVFDVETGAPREPVTSDTDTPDNSSGTAAPAPVEG